MSWDALLNLFKSDKHVCWFDGVATLRILERRIGKSVPLSEEEAKELGLETTPKSPSAGQPEAGQETAPAPATPEVSANEQPGSAPNGIASRGPGN